MWQVVHRSTCVSPKAVTIACWISGDRDSSSARSRSFFASFGRYVPFVLMALATPSVFYCAAPVLRIAWAVARTGVLRMESLLAMGILMAYGYSAAAAFSGSNHVYFDTACAIVTLVLTGKAIERGAKEKTARAITLLYRLMPNKARLMADGRERFVALEALRTGMVFRVKSGERIPADGVVVEGRSHADESVLTGESAPRPKGPGDRVVCGSINTGGVLEIRATRFGAESTLAHIARTVAQADLGIALGSGADIAMQAAPLVLMNNSLAAVTQTLDLARRAFRIVRQNLFWAFAYNVAGITLAMVGVLNPILAAGAMVLSSLSVIGNSRRLA